jgi:hypothetical protein
MKPTGDVECPPHIECAHEIEDAMNNKAGSRDLDDEDIIDDNVMVNSSGDDNGDEPLVAGPAVVRSKKDVIKAEPGSAGPVVQRVPADHLTTSSHSQRHSRTITQDFLMNISSVLDPELHTLRTVLLALSKLVKFLALPRSFGRCRTWSRCCAITFLRLTENIMQLSIVLTMLR